MMIETEGLRKSFGDRVVLDGIDPRVAEGTIQVKGLQKSYKQLHVLKGVDFEVEKGSIFALLGSNGAGKTTIVKILTTLLPPDEGSVTIGGFQLPGQIDQARALLGLVPNVRQLQSWIRTILRSRIYRNL